MFFWNSQNKTLQQGWSAVLLKVYTGKRWRRWPLVGLFAQGSL